VDELANRCCIADNTRRLYDPRSSAAPALVQLFHASNCFPSTRASRYLSRHDVWDRCVIAYVASRRAFTHRPGAGKRSAPARRRPAGPVDRQAAEFCEERHRGLNRGDGPRAATAPPFDRLTSARPFDGLGPRRPRESPRPCRGAQSLGGVTLCCGGAARRASRRGVVLVSYGRDSSRGPLGDGSMLNSTFWPSSRSAPPMSSMWKNTSSSVELTRSRQYR